MSDAQDPNRLQSSWDCHGRFAPHGEFTLRVEGKILYYEAVGPFNLEGIEALRTTRSKAYKKWQLDQTFAAIVHWRNSALMSLDAFDAYREGYLAFVRAMPHRPVVAWVAGPDVEGMAMMLRKFEDVFHQTDTRFQFGSDLGAAHQWVETTLASDTTNP